MKFFTEYALLPTGLANNVTVEVVDGRFSQVSADSAPLDATRLPGVLVPGFANCHSHAFHRALRGRTSDDGGDFWTWRQRMYAVAARLDPDSYLALARATFAEMALSGVTSVGEFHYLHHAPGGAHYSDPNAMAEALRQAAVDAGIRLTLLDTCYLAGGLNAEGHLPLDNIQLRFADRNADSWANRVAELKLSSGMQLGTAIHSVRAVPREQIPQVVLAAANGVLHVHLSEQPAENDACQAFYGCSPTALLDDAGALRPRTTAVHATHLTDLDIGTLARTGTTTCFCPTTERDLADGIGRARALLDAGATLSLGSDQHTVIDLLEEARALEMHERLISLQRGRFQPTELLTALTRHDSIGWDSGRLEVGAAADLVSIRLDTPNNAGVDPAGILLTASRADIDSVMVDGRLIVSGGQHVLGHVGSLLRAAILPLWRDDPS